MQIRLPNQTALQSGRGTSHALQQGQGNKYGLNKTSEQTPASEPSAQRSVSVSDSHKILNDQVIAALEQHLSQAGRPSLYTLNADDFTPEKVAERIMGVVSNALQSASDNNEDMKTRLSQAREGIEDGFNQAKDMLTGLGVYEGEIKDNAEQTYSLLQQGLNNFDQRINNGEPIANVDDRRVEAYQSTSFSQKQSVELEVKTRDGDTVKLTLYKEQGASQSQYASQNANGQTTFSEQSTFAGASLSYKVQGNIDEEELRAIDDLVGEIKGLSDEYFSGDVQAAIEQAQNLGYDSQQLTSFNLHIREVQETRVTHAYREVASLDNADKPAAAVLENVSQPFSTFISHLIKALKHTQESDFFSHPEKAFMDLFNGLPMMDTNSQSVVSQLEARAGKAFKQISDEMVELVKPYTQQKQDL